MSKHLTSEPIIMEGIVEHDGLTYYVLKPGSNIQVNTLIGYDAIIIEANNAEFTHRMVVEIRRHMSHAYYLKPIFLLKSGGEKSDSLVDELVDGTIFSLEQVKLVTPSVQRIYFLSNEIKINNTVSFEAMLILKMLAFLYTREKREISPLVSFDSGIGYSFPILSVNFHKREEYKVLEILETAEKEGLIYSEFHDKTHLCSQCHTGFLAYREVCPKCSSANSESQDIIHHFVCGYVGPISDFSNEIDDQLNCPKCNKMLRHIGVDYDKPSVLHECFNCGHKFQDFNVKAKCMTCSYDNLVEQLIAREIFGYTLSKKGELAVINGYTSTSKDIEEIIGTVKLDTFRTMLKYEIERIRQTEGKSNLAAIHITNAGEIYSKIGADTQKSLLRDLVQLVRRNIRSSDMITFYDSNTILLSMNDIPLKVGQHILEEITEMIRKLLRTNFKDLDLNLKYNVNKITHKLSSELQVQQLIKDFYPDA